MPGYNHPMESQPSSWKTVLRRLAAGLDALGLDYKVAGGTSAALHGVDVPVKDIDLEMSAGSAYRFQEHYHEFTLHPVALSESPQYRSHYGTFQIDGVLVDVMGDLQWREGGEWRPIQTRTLALLDLDGQPVRTSWLEEETLAYIRRGRLERAALCLVKCDSPRLLSLIRGEVACGVL